MVSDQIEDRVSLLFSLDNSQGFTLHCPSHYPDYTLHEDNFFVEADSGLQLWCNALNEFLHGHTIANAQQHAH